MKGHLNLFRLSAAEHFASLSRTLRTQIAPAWPSAYLPKALGGARAACFLLRRGIKWQRRASSGSQPAPRMFEQLPDPAPEWSNPWWLSFLGLCLVCWIAAWVWIPEDKAVPGGARRCQASLPVWQRTTPLPAI